MYAMIVGDAMILWVTLLPGLLIRMLLHLHLNGKEGLKATLFRPMGSTILMQMMGLKTTPLYTNHVKGLRETTNGLELALANGSHWQGPKIV